MCTSINTNNFFESNPLSTSEIYTSSKFSPTISKLAQHSPYTTKKIFNIQSCEIDHKLPSPAQNMVDVLYQSNQPWEQFINSSTKMSILRDQDFKTFDVLFNYLYLFQSVAFNSFFTYLSSNPTPFQGNANNIIQQQYNLYKLIEERLRIAPNTSLQFNVRIPVHPTASHITSNNVETVVQHYDDSSDEDVEANEDANYIMLRKRNVYKSLDTGKQIGTFNNIDIIQQIARPKDNPFSYENIEIVFEENMEYFTVYNTNNSIAKETIQYNHTLNPILNSVNSMRNVINTLTFLYIVYNQCIMVYAYITTVDNKSFGSRIFKEDLIHTIPRLFEDSSINDNIKSDIENNLKCKQDKEYNKCKAALLKNNECDEKKEEFDEFEIKVQKTVNMLNAARVTHKFVDFTAIKDMFNANDIHKEYFADGRNRKQFIEIITNNGFVLCVADELWYKLGGVPFDIDNEVYIDMKEEHNTDLESDLNGLAVDIMHMNNENYEIMFTQQLIDLMEAQNKCTQELLHCYENDNETNDNGMQYFSYEDPPW